MGRKGVEGTEGEWGERVGRGTWGERGRVWREREGGGEREGGEVGEGKRGGEGVGRQVGEGRDDSYTYCNRYVH